MGLISTEVEIVINKRQGEKYLKQGYSVPIALISGEIDCCELLVNVKDIKKSEIVRVEVECDKCGKRYTLQYRNYHVYSKKHNGYIYCHQCAARLAMGGEKHYLWQADKTSEQRILQRTSQDNIDFIKAVMLRDNYCCVVCGERANAVHHLNAYHGYPLLRYEPTNGIALCTYHHKAFHCWQQEEYGFSQIGYCTKEQFEKWYGKVLELKKQNISLPVTKTAVCLENGEIIDNVGFYARQHNLKSSAIYACCNHRFKEYKGLHYLWKKEYDTLTIEDIENYINTQQSFTYEELRGENVYNAKKVVCVTYNTFFACISNAAKYYNIPNQCTISSCCKHKQKYTRSNGEKLSWLYYEEYVKIFGTDNLIYIDKLKEVNNNG